MHIAEAKNSKNGDEKKLKRARSAADRGSNGNAAERVCVRLHSIIVRTAAVGIDALVRRVEERDERSGQQAAHVVLHVRRAHRATRELLQRRRLEHAALAREPHHQRTARRNSRVDTSE